MALRGRSPKATPWPRGSPVPVLLLSSACSLDSSHIGPLLVLLSATFLPATDPGICHPLCLPAPPLFLCPVTSQVSALVPSCRRPARAPQGLLAGHPVLPFSPCPSEASAQGPPPPGTESSTQQSSSVWSPLSSEPACHPPRFIPSSSHSSRAPDFWLGLGCPQLDHFSQSWDSHVTKFWVVEYVWTDMRNFQLCPSPVTSSL